MLAQDDPQVMVHLQRGKQYFLTAIRYDDHNFLIFRDYAIFLEYMDDLEGAEDYYIRSLSINPNQMECLRFGFSVPSPYARANQILVQALWCISSDFSRRTR